MSPLFIRPPRIQTGLPEQRVEIPPPPALPPSPAAMSWLTALLPVAAVLLVVLVSALLLSGGASWTQWLLFLPMTLATVGATAFTARRARKVFREQVNKIREDYRAELNRAHDRLTLLQQRQQEVLRAANPDLNECLERARRPDAQLGERRPQDADFLAPRLGLGRVSTSLELVAAAIKVHPPELEDLLAAADQLYETFSVVDEVPVPARLTHTGSIGVSGARNEVLGVTRAILGHLATHHWLTELQIGVACNPERLRHWLWLEKLPHARQLPWLPGGKTVDDESNEPAPEFMRALEVELQDREQVVESQRALGRADVHTEHSRSAEAPLPRLIIVFDYLPIDYSHPALTLLLKKGPQLGAYGIFLTAEPHHIPGECGAMIEVFRDRLSYKETGPTGRKSDCHPADTLDFKQAEALAGALAAVRWAEQSDLSAPPEQINFLELFGVRKVEALPVETWWDKQSPWGYLRAPIGRTSATSDLIFDLNDRDGAHGPHGLVGGRTGSGKSEVLKSMILALALTHHPYDLNFALVDYKGGAAFGDLEKLPHTVGIVTDIETHASYAGRVILALSSELKTRERILENARAAFGFSRSHIDEYRQLAVKQVLPRLVIVFDEFAEFKQRHPEESKKLISIARLGRSLGVHLILATQNISAAIDEQIAQNSTFKICLRQSAPQDSVQLIGIPDAIHLARGRAYFSAQTRQLFQAAFSGACYTGGEESDGLRAERFVKVWPDGRREPVGSPRPARIKLSRKSHRKTEARAVIERIQLAYRNLQLEKPRPVWPDPLPEQIQLPRLFELYTSGGWDGAQWQPCQIWEGRGSSQAEVFPILGLYDNPAKQEQYLYQLDPQRNNGHLLIFGAAGSGKSTLLRTLVVGLARIHPPAEVQVYILDFGGQSALDELRALPHVGAVVTRGELERAERLLQFIQGELARRNDAFRARRVGSLEDYNARVSAGERSERLPRLYFLIDGFSELKRIFPPEAIKNIAAFVSGSAAVGLYLIIAANLQSDVPNELFANINERVTFAQADQGEYFRIVGMPGDARLKEDAGGATPPGRGLIRGAPPLEFQAALPGAEAEPLDELGRAMRRAWPGPRPKPIETLPELVTLPWSPKSPDFGTSPDVGQRQETLDSGRPRPPMRLEIGRDYETLEPIGLALDEDGPTFLVASAVGQSGKTALLQTWLLGLAERFTPAELRVTILDFHTRALRAFRRLPHVVDYVGAKAELDAALARVLAEAQKRAELLDQAYATNPDVFDQAALLRQLPHWLVVIDNYDVLSPRLGKEKEQLVNCLGSGADLGISMIVSGNAAELPRDFDDALIRRMRKQGCGYLLGGSAGMDQFNGARAAYQTPNLPPGRGYLVKRGQARLIQAAVFWSEKDECPEAALAQRLDAIADWDTDERG